MRPEDSHPASSAPSPDVTPQSAMDPQDVPVAPVAPNLPKLPNSITETASFKADLPLAVDDVTSGKRHGGFALFALVVCIVALCAVGYYLFSQNSSNDLPVIGHLELLDNGTISQDDLALEKATKTSYLRPRQWSAQDGIGGFGASEQSHEKPIALVVVKEGAIEAQFANASASTYQELRAKTAQVLKDQIELQNKMQTSTSCVAPPTGTVEPDSSSSESVIGLASVVVRCSRDDDEYIVKSRFVIGTDGGQRTITVAAVKKQWDKNDGIFQKILDSIQVSSN